MDKDFLIDRFAGSLLGAAIGDAMGAPAEGLSPYAVMSRFNFIDGFFSHSGADAGQYTYETLCACYIAREMQQTGTFIEPDILNSFDKINAKVIYNKAMGARTLFSRALPIGLLAASHQSDPSTIVKQIKFVAAPLSMPKSHALGMYLYAMMIQESICNSKQLTKPYELYDANRSLLARMIDIARSSEAKMTEDDLEDRLSERLIYVRKKLMVNYDLARFIGSNGAGGSMGESLAAIVFNYLRCPDDFMTICRTVSLGGPAAMHGAAVGGLIGASIGSSLLPQDMKDQVLRGLTIETLGINFATKCCPDEIPIQDEGEIIDDAG